MKKKKEIVRERIYLTVPRELVKEPVLSLLAKQFDVEAFIVGHQPQEMGHAVVLDRVIILASNHSHGTFLPFDLSKPKSVDDLVGAIRKFVEVA